MSENNRLSKRDFLKIAGGFFAGYAARHLIGWVSNSTQESGLPSEITAPSLTVVPPATEALAATPASLPTVLAPQPQNIGFIKSIDTMKSSRDRAREGRPQEWIDQHIELIANANSTHVAIGTPYDEEFETETARWVNSARQKNLNVWFRGNMSYWEGWFGYRKNNDIGAHLYGIHNFLTRNGHLLQPGDIFTPAPEAENGLGNVWESEETKQNWRDFLTASYDSAGSSLASLGINGVNLGYYSMNGDVATILTPEVVRKIGNVVAIDHYVANPVMMGEHITRLQNQYPDAKIVIGEYGAPIPDINGEMDETTQDQFVGQLINQIVDNGAVGMNYWVLWDGSTRLVNDDFTPRKVYATVTNKYASIK